MTSIETLVPERLWQAIQPLLPVPAPRYGGRPRVDDRAALAGIVYQLRTGVPWRLLPTRELGCGSPVTCWRRLRDWQRAGVWRRLHQVLLDHLGREARLDWSRASLDSLSVRAKRGAGTLIAVFEGYVLQKLIDPQLLPDDFFARLLVRFFGRLAELDRHQQASRPPTHPPAR
jgi:transposase